MKQVLQGILAFLAVVLTVAVSAFAGVIMAFLGIVLKFALLGGMALVFLYMLISEWITARSTNPK